MNWIAKYTDGTSLSQFVGDAENLFSDIEIPKMESFTVEDFGHIVIVYPKTGEYVINGQAFQYSNFSDDEYLELVYFRRVRRHIDSVRGMNNPPEYFQHIGLRNVGKANQVRSKQLLIEITKDNGVRICTK